MMTLYHTAVNRPKSPFEIIKSFLYCFIKVPNFSKCVNEVAGIKESDILRYICGAISGGHINPAISVAMAVMQRLPLYKLPIYLLAQYLGAFVGAGFIYCVYYG